MCKREYRKDSETTVVHVCSHLCFDLSIDQRHSVLWEVNKKRDDAAAQGLYTPPGVEHARACTLKNTLGSYR